MSDQAQRKGDTPLFQFHNLACYLYWILVLKGAYLYFGLIARNTIYPTALAIAILSQILYCLPWFWFVSRKDRFAHQPNKLALLALLWGGLVATWVMSVPGNSSNLSLMVKLVSVEFHNAWGAAITAPIVEESSKFAGIVIISLLFRSHFRNAYDGFLLGAFVGLGFQVFENVLYMVNQAGGNFGSQQAVDAFQVLIVRVGAGFWSHALYSAITGAGLGYYLGATDRSKAHRLGVAILLFLLACVAHGLWDAALAYFAFPLFGLLIGTVAIIAVWRFSEHQQQDVVRAILASEVGNGTLTQAELDALAGRPKDRRTYLKQMAKVSGKQAATQFRQRLQAAIDLAAAIESSNDPQSPEAKSARSKLRNISR